MLLILISSYMRSVCILYSGRQLYQYNEDDFFIQVLIANKLFSNQKLSKRSFFVAINILKNV